MTNSRSKRWTAGMSEQEVEDFDKHWAASVEVRSRLGEIITEKVLDTQRDRLRLEEYDSPNWQLKQMQYNTKEKLLLDLLNLL